MLPCESLNFLIVFLYLVSGEPKRAVASLLIKMRGGVGKRAEERIHPFNASLSVKNLRRTGFEISTEYRAWLFLVLTFLRVIVIFCGKILFLTNGNVKFRI